MDEVQGFHGAVLGEMLKGVDVGGWEAVLILWHGHRPQGSPPLSCQGTSTLVAVRWAAILDALRADGAVITKQPLPRIRSAASTATSSSAIDNASLPAQAAGRVASGLHGIDRIRSACAATACAEQQPVGDPAAAIDPRPRRAAQARPVENIPQDAGGYWLNSAQANDIQPRHAEKLLHRDPAAVPHLQRTAVPTPPRRVASISLSPFSASFAAINGAHGRVILQQPTAGGLRGGRMRTDARDGEEFPPSMTPKSRVLSSPVVRRHGGGGKRDQARKRGGLSP